jgi:hypothetical protein
MVNNKQELFDFLSGVRLYYAYVESLVKIVDNKITDVEWVDIVVGFHYDEKQIISDILEIDNIGNNADGFYVLNILFSIQNDSDDYRRWSYYIPEVVECKFDSSLNENETLGDLSDDILPIFK